MNTIPVDTIFGAYIIGNGTIPIAAHPVLVDRLATLICAGVPFLQPPIVQHWTASGAAGRYLPVDLEPGQIGWSVAASCVGLDGTKDDDGNLVTQPVLQVTLFTEDLGAVLSLQTVDLPVVTPHDGVLAFLDAPGAGQVVSAGTGRSTDPAARDGLLWVASATRSVRHCVAVVAGENVGVAWLQLTPVWDHSTAIADMGA